MWFFFQLFLANYIFLVKLIHDIHLSNLKPCVYVVSTLTWTAMNFSKADTFSSSCWYTCPEPGILQNVQLSVCIIEMKSGWMFQNNTTHNSQQMSEYSHRWTGSAPDFTYLFLCLLPIDFLRMCSRKTRVTTGHS